MSQKEIQLEGLGQITIQKRRGARSVRLTINHDGKIRVTIPSWTPYKVAVAFVDTKRDWILKQHAVRSAHMFEEAERIGKSHRLRFVQEQRHNTTSRVTKTELTIRLPSSKDYHDEDVQNVVRAGAIRALKQEARTLLPARLQQLAQQNGFSYNTVSIKLLRSRWGSCSSKQDIALNCFLMQLPWELIDYVLLHELLHTRVMAHGSTFWNELGQYVNNLAQKRAALRAHQPALNAQI